MVFLISMAGPAIAAPQAPPFEQANVWAPISVYMDPTPRLRHIPATQEYQSMARRGIQTANLHINYIAAGQPDRSGNTCQTWPAAAASAFDYAVNIWETVITSTVPIEIVACWTSSLPAGVLGQSGADSYYRNFTGAPQDGTWYVTSLANALHGSRMNGSTVDMHISYSSTFDWYFGTDGNTPANQTDFATVVLHEVGHGLGFAGSMAVQGGYGYWAWGNSNPDYQDPTMYDRLAREGASTMLLSLGNGTTALGSALTGDDVYFTGAYATAANGGVPPELHAPAQWQQGSSYSHLNESYNTSNGGRDSLMTWSINRGESIHRAGPVTVGVLKDVGWAQVGGGENTAPTLSIPDVAMAINTTRALDLWAYANDAEDADSALTFAVVSVSDANVTATLAGDGHTLNITPAASWTGSANVQVRVTDSGGMTANDTFAVTVTGGGNTAPTLEISNVSLGVNENQSLNLWDSASDAEDADAALTFTVVSVSDSHLDAVLDGDGHTLNLTPAADWTGAATVVVNVRDTGGLTAEDSFDVTVNGGSNTPPTLSIPDFAMAANATETLDLWTYAQDAQDADSALTFSVGFIFDSELTAVLRADGHTLDITTSSAWTGGTLMEVDVADTGGLTGYSMFWVDLAGGNVAPHLDIPDISLAVDESRALDMWDYAYDDDNAISELTFAVMGVDPANLTAEIGLDGHTLDLTPDTGWTGAVTVSMQVADPGDLTADDAFVVYVGGGGNTAPTLDIPDVSLAADANTTINLWDYAADVEDADNTLIFTVEDTYDTELTATLRDGHLLDIASTANWWGFTIVIVNVEDPGGLTASSVFWVEIGGGGENTAPTLDIPDVSLAVNETHTLDLWDYADDAEDADATLVFTVENVSTLALTVTLESGHNLAISPQPGWTGTATVEISVSDPDMATASDTFDVIVSELNYVYLPLVMR